jgi:hypothetical protein
MFGNQEHAAASTTKDGPHTRVHGHAMKHIKRTLALLLLAFFPLTAQAEAGELGGLAVMAMEVFAVFWVASTLLLFLLPLRRLSVGKRFGFTALFFFSPAIWLALALLKDYAWGETATDKTVITTEPLTLYGATFPPGSEAEYEQTGGFFGWHAQRTLQNIHGPHPVLMGKLRIDGFIFIPANREDEIRVQLSAGETIDGWPCGDTMVDLTPNGPVLKSCFLSAPRVWQGQSLPAGAYVMPGESY